MRPDEARMEDCRGWLEKAARDLRAADHDLKADPPLLEDTVFHCQQASEKVLKGFLAWHDCAFRKTHNLEEVGELCLRIAPSLEAVVDRAVPLTEYAWKYRYPGDSEEPDRGEAEEALAIARDLFQAIVALLPCGILPDQPA